MGGHIGDRRTHLHKADVRHREHPRRESTGGGGGGTTIVNVVGVPAPIGPGDVWIGTRTISTTDSDYVTLLEKTTAHAIFGNIVLTRTASATGGQVVSYRCYVNDILVDERSITWPADASNTRCAKLLIRAPGSVSVANTSETGVGGDTFTATSTEIGASTPANNTAYRGMIQSPFAFAPDTIRIEMKATTISVSSTYGARFYAYPCAISGTYWNGLVTSYRGQRTKPQSTAADSDYVELLSIDGPGQLLSPAFLIRTTTGSPSSVADYKTTIDGYDMQAFNFPGSGGSSTQNLVLEGHGPIRFGVIDGTVTSPEGRLQDFWTHHVGPKFSSSFKVWSKMAATGVGSTNTHRVEVLVGFF